MKSNFIRLFLFLPIDTDSELEELETTPRYRPDSLSALSRTTRFSEAEIKRIYRGFKAECPTGVVKEDTFKIIYSQFFPQGGMYACIYRYLFARAFESMIIYSEHTIFIQIFPTKYNEKETCRPSLPPPPTTPKNKTKTERKEETLYVTDKNCGRITSNSITLIFIIR